MLLFLWKSRISKSAETERSLGVTLGLAGAGGIETGWLEGRRLLVR